MPPPVWEVAGAGDTIDLPRAGTLHGIAAQTVIGCRPLPFESHAWVEVEGQIVNDRPQYQRAFQVLDRL